MRIYKPLSLYSIGGVPGISKDIYGSDRSSRDRRGLKKVIIRRDLSWGYVRKGRTSRGQEEDLRGRGEGEEEWDPC